MHVMYVLSIDIAFFIDVHIALSRTQHECLSVCRYPAAEQFAWRGQCVRRSAWAIDTNAILHAGHFVNSRIMTSKAISIENFVLHTPVSDKLNFYDAIHLQSHFIGASHESNERMRG